MSSSSSSRSSSSSSASDSSSSSRDNSPVRKQKKPVVKMPSSLLALILCDPRFASLVNFEVVQHNVLQKTLDQWRKYYACEQKWTQFWSRARHQSYEVDCTVVLKPYQIFEGENNYELSRPTLESFLALHEDTGTAGEFDKSLAPYLNRQFFINAADDIHWLIDKLLEVHLLLVPRLYSFFIDPNTTRILVDFDLSTSKPKERNQVLYKLCQLRELKATGELPKQLKNYLGAPLTLTGSGNGRIKAVDRFDLDVPAEEAHGTFQEQLTLLATYCQVEDLKLQDICKKNYLRPIGHIRKKAEAEEEQSSFEERASAIYTSYRW